MLKQLNELRKRCTCLEAQIAKERDRSAQLEERDTTMLREIDAIEAKFIEATELSRTANSEIQRVAIQLQQTETDNAVLRVKVASAEQECGALKETYRQLREKYDHILVDAGVMCIPELEDKGENTVDERILIEKECQFPGKDWSSEMFPFDETTELRAPLWISMQDEAAEDEISSLIVMLNHH
jgi:chromosome segregation ATPase